MWNNSLDFGVWTVAVASCREESRKEIWYFLVGFGYALGVGLDVFCKTSMTNRKKINNVGLELKKCIHFHFNLSPSSQKNISIYQKKCILNIN